MKVSDLKCAAINLDCLSAVEIDDLNLENGVIGSCHIVRSMDDDQPNVVINTSPGCVLPDEFANLRGILADLQDQGYLYVFISEDF